MEKQLETGIGYEILIDESLPAIINVYTGEAQTSAQFRAHVQRIIDFYREYTATFPQLGYISDNKKMGALDPEDLEWATQNFTPAVMETGLKGMAFVVTEDVFAQFNVDTFTEESAANFGFYVKYYTTREEAKTFLVQKLA